MFPRIIFVISYKLMRIKFLQEAIALECRTFLIYLFLIMLKDIFFQSGSSSIRISPSAEFNVTKVLGFPDDNTLLIDLDRSLPQDLVEKCVF